MKTFDPNSSASVISLIKYQQHLKLKEENIKALSETQKHI